MKDVVLRNCREKLTCICATRGRRIVRVEEEVGIAGNGEVVDCERIERFGCLYLSGWCARSTELRKEI